MPTDLELRQYRLSQINEKVREGDVVKYDVIFPETRADVVKETFNTITKANEWKSSTSYILGDNVYVQDAGTGAITSYECIMAHTSGAQFVPGTAWKKILSRRFVTPADEINWNGGGAALKYRGRYVTSATYKLHDVVTLKDDETGKEEHFICISSAPITGTAPVFDSNTSAWKNLNSWATHAIDATQVKTSSLDEHDGSVYLTFVVAEADGVKDVHTATNLVYDINLNKLDVIADMAVSFDKTYGVSFGEDGRLDTLETPVKTSIADEFKALRETINALQIGNLVLGHGLSIQVNGVTKLSNWKASTDEIVNIEVNSSTVSDWDTATTAILDNKANARYVRYDAAQSLTDEQKTQARKNINAAPAGNYPVMDSNNKILVENLPDTVVGGLQYKGTYNASVVSTVVPEIGDYYIVSVAGNYDPAGGVHEVVNSESNYFLIGDWAIYNGPTDGWAKIDNTDSIKSVNGQIGNVKTYKGVYSSTAAYHQGDWVLSGGILYLAIADSTGHGVSETAYWQVAGRIYEGADGIVVDGSTIKHSAEHTANSATSGTISANGGQFSVDVNTYDAQGHVTATTPKNITLSQTWREIKVGENVLIASNDNSAVTFKGSAPISVTHNSADHSITVSHNSGTEVTGEINLTIGSNGAVEGSVVSSNSYGHVNGTRALKINNVALKDGAQTLSGVKTYKNDDNNGTVILPEATEVYDIGASTAKFRNIYSKSFTGSLVGNADSASKWQTARNFSIQVLSGKKSNGSDNILGTKVIKSVDGTAAVEWQISLGESGVAAGTYSCVEVNAQGIVTKGGNVIEFGSTVDSDPSALLAVGGLFFRMVEAPTV